MLPSHLQAPTKGKRHDLSGIRFHKLVVLCEAERDPRYKSRSLRWLCQCDCGNKTIVRSQLLKSGSIKACGCLLYKGHEDLSATYYGVVKHNSEMREVPFELTIQQMWELFVLQDKKCALSGLLINLTRHYSGANRDVQTASLDRIDSSKGYVEGNVQWVHKDVNSLKSDFNQEIFIQYCKQIAAHNDSLNNLSHSGVSSNSQT